RRDCVAAGGTRMPGEAATIAGVCEIFERAAGTAGERVARGNLLQETRTGHRRCQSPSTVNGGGRRENAWKGLIQPKGKILLQIFCRCRKRNRAVQFAVDDAKSGAGSQGGAAAIDI